jgi:hypothetical protein
MYWEKYNIAVLKTVCKYMSQIELKIKGTLKITVDKNTVEG